MINFIVCDDEKSITESVKNIITKVMIKNNIEYKIHIFNEYDANFTKIIKSDIENKIYILDIEVGKKSGLDVAKIIRKTDWNSVILILSAHYELEILAYKSKILLFDFISKFDLYDKKIYDTITLCVDNKINTEELIIKVNKRIEKIQFSNILYITYDSYIRKLKIKTKNREYETNDSLKSIWEHSPKLKYLRNLRKKDLKDCVDCSNQKFCSVCMVRNANENADGNPLKINKNFCKIAELNKNIVFEWKKKLQN